ncbi:DNA-binding protein [Jeongeupia chitinilytica]|uniref:DNA-binding protein n=1 Tax=Jeongeupia chitinilytica TaxID=1041641 RepID=UPI00167AB3D6
MKLLSIAEILKLQLPGMPRSREGVRSRANLEGWSYKERSGSGGTQKLYLVPARYTNGSLIPLDVLRKPHLKI